MKAIVFSDPHIDEKSIDELEEVFTEILRYSKGKPLLICGGDWYDRKNPSPREIDFGTKWVLKFKKEFADFYMISGNHPAIDKDISGISYMRHLGINTEEDAVIENVYYGHYMVKESLCGFNEERNAIDLITNHPLSILGHQHSFQVIKLDGYLSEIVHPGSCRYVDFGEVQDKNKYILVVEDEHFIEVRLNKVRPMYEVTTIQQLETLPRTAQVRYVYTDFNKFVAEGHLLDKYRKEFYNFKIKFNFQSPAPQININNNQDCKEVVNKWLNTINNNEVKKILLDEFKNSGIIV